MNPRSSAGRPADPARERRRKGDDAVRVERRSPGSATRRAGASGSSLDPDAGLDLAPGLLEVLAQRGRAPVPKIASGASSGV